KGHKLPVLKGAFPCYLPQEIAAEMDVNPRRYCRNLSLFGRDFCGTPVKFPVCREFGGRPARSALRRQPGPRLLSRLLSKSYVLWSFLRRTACDMKIYRFLGVSPDVRSRQGLRKNAERLRTVAGLFWFSGANVGDLACAAVAQHLPTCRGGGTRARPCLQIE